MTESVNTKTVDRRELWFDSIDDCLEEVSRIGQAAEKGSLQTQGNWSAGQVLSHVSAWIEYGYDGYPMKPPPFFIRWFLRMQLKKALSKGVPAGVRIPGIKEGTTGHEEMDVEAAVDRLQKALERLKTEQASFDSPAFGKMSHEDRILLNLRHAELHLGFLYYD